MIYPPIKELTEKASSRYALVIAAAKRARELSVDTDSEVSKPLIEAIREIEDGKTIISKN